MQPPIESAAGVPTLDWPFLLDHIAQSFPGAVPGMSDEVADQNVWRGVLHVQLGVNRAERLHKFRVPFLQRILIDRCTTNREVPSGPPAVKVTACLRAALLVQYTTDSTVPPVIMMLQTHELHWASSLAISVSLTQLLA